MNSFSTFIRDHIDWNPSEVALKSFPDLPWSAVEIASALRTYQVLKRKIPSWYMVDGLKVGGSQSLEQASSEHTARYKATLFEQYGLKTGADLSGGLGVDSFFISQKAKEWVFLEKNNDRVQEAIHNFKRLEANTIVPIQGSAEHWIKENELEFDLFYVDPDRRPQSHKRVFLLEETIPNPVEILKALPKESWKWVKSSPMVDLNEGFEKLNAKEVHLLSIANELKELIWVIPPESYSRQEKRCIAQELIYAWNHQVIEFNQTKKEKIIASDKLESGGFFYIPSTLLAKIKSSDTEAISYGLKSISKAKKTYYFSEKIPSTAPFRAFQINKEVELNSRFFRKEGIKKVQMILRTNKLDESGLLKKLKLKHGSSNYLLVYEDVHKKMRAFLCSYHLPK